MAIDLISIRSGIANLLSKNNTTTSAYNISLSMTAAVQQVITGYHTSLPQATWGFPAVFVELKNKSDGFAVMGRQARRDATIQFEIVTVVQDGFAQVTGREVSDRQMILLTQNIENLFRNFINLSMSSSIKSSNVTGTEFDVVESNDTYNSVSKISLQVEAFG